LDVIFREKNLSKPAFYEARSDEANLNAVLQLNFLFEAYGYKEQA
jgi:hypothetical protein